MMALVSLAMKEKIRNQMVLPSSSCRWQFISFIDVNLICAHTHELTTDIQLKGICYFLGNRKRPTRRCKAKKKKEEK